MVKSNASFWTRCISKYSSKIKAAELRSDAFLLTPGAVVFSFSCLCFDAFNALAVLFFEFARFFYDSRNCSVHLGRSHMWNETEIKLKQNWNEYVLFQPTTDDTVLFQFCFSASHMWNKTMKQSS